MSQEEYPDWVCKTCGWQWGRFPKQDRISCWHEGKCDICNDSEVPVTEPRDFGYLKEGWEKEARAKS